MFSSVFNILRDMMKTILFCISYHGLCFIKLWIFPRSQFWKALWILFTKQIFVAFGVERCTICHKHNLYDHAVLKVDFLWNLSMWSTWLALLGTNKPIGSVLTQTLCSLSANKELIFSKNPSGWLIGDDQIIKLSSRCFFRFSRVCRNI